MGKYIALTPTSFSGNDYFKVEQTKCGISYSFIEKDKEKATKFDSEDKATTALKIAGYNGLRGLRVVEEDKADVDVED